MSATNDRVTNPGLLTSSPQKGMSTPMDFEKIQKTDDIKVSIVDVIAQIKNCTQQYTAKMYRRLVEEERVPDCEARLLMSAKCGRQKTQSLSHSCCLSNRDYTNQLAAPWRQRISQKLCQ